MTNEIISEVYNMDCVEGMRQYPDKYFDLAIVDPPYGIGAENHAGNAENGWKQWDKKNWDSSIPNEEYFTELFRVSKNQIIWGAIILQTYCQTHKRGFFGIKGKGILV